MMPDNKIMIKDMTWIIMAFGVLVAIFEVIFAKRVIYSVLGLFIGCILAVYMLIYMDRILERCMGLEAKAVEKYVIKHSIIRYFTVVIVFAILCFTNIADPLACFIGLMGLKIAAYLQPVVSKLRGKKLTGLRDD